MINTGDIPYSLQYSTNIVTGTIDYQTETANLIIQINLHGNEVWFSSLQKAIQTVFTGLNATGRKNDWGLVNWPQQGVSNKNPFATEKQYDFAIAFELLNEDGRVIGRQTLSLKPVFQFYRPRNDTNKILIDYLGDFYRTMTFNAVKVDDISDNLTIRIGAINGKQPQNTPLPITAVSNPDWKPQLFFNHLQIENRAVKGFKSEYEGGLSKLQIKQYYDFVFPENVWGTEMTSIVTTIARSAFGYGDKDGFTTLTIPSGINTIESGAFFNFKITKITIGAGVNIASLSFENHSFYGYIYFPSFPEFYESNGRMAGTYTFDEKTKRWSWSI